MQFARGAKEVTKGNIKTYECGHRYADHMVSDLFETIFNSKDFPDIFIFRLSNKDGLYEMWFSGELSIFEILKRKLAYRENVKNIFILISTRVIVSRLVF